MATASPPVTRPTYRVVETRPALPVWPARAAALGMFAIIFGLYWDISWHMSIGRDTFWTPAHISIQLGGVLAAVVSSYLIFTATFGRGLRATGLRRSSVCVWGFHGPLGAFVAAWGGATMATSAPLDNWWHNAYGVDVQILSPPHAVLMLGFGAVSLGALLLMAGAHPGRLAGSAMGWLGLEGGILLALQLILVNTYLVPQLQHTALPYRAVAFGVPGLLLALGAISHRRWGATRMAAVYMGLMLAGLWIMPRFPAQPRLGPVYTPITHMLTLGFPLWLVAPGLAFDLLRPRLRAWARPQQAVALGTAFIAALVLAQWPFADWLLSPGARRQFWGMTEFPYSTRPSTYHLAYIFQPPGHPLAVGLTLAAAIAMLSSWCGLWGGAWLEKLQR